VVKSPGLALFDLHSFTQNCTFSFRMQLQSHNIIMSSAMAVNEQVICCTFPTSSQNTMEEWCSMKCVATSHFSSSEKQPTPSHKWCH